MPENKIITDHLKVLFTEDELRQKGLTLAQTMGEIDHLENEKKAMASDFKGKIDAKSADVKKLKDQINNGYDYLPVKCEVRYNLPTPGIKQIVRLDTLEVVSSVEMTGDERQLKITDLQQLEQADAPFATIDGGKKGKKKKVETETTQADRETMEHGKEDFKNIEVAPDNKSEDEVDQPAEGDDIKERNRKKRLSGKVTPATVSEDQEPKKSKAFQKMEKDLKAVDKKHTAKTRPIDDVFATRTAEWFVERIGKDIEAKNANPKKFTGVMKIDDQVHAEYLAGVSQNQGGFSYRDVQKVG